MLGKAGLRVHRGVKRYTMGIHCVLPCIAQTPWSTTKPPPRCPESGQHMPGPQTLAPEPAPVGTARPPDRGHKRSRSWGGGTRP